MRKLLFLSLLFAFVLSSRAAQKATVAELEHALAEAHGKRDQDLAKLLGGMELSERLNPERLAKLRASLPGEKSRTALLVLADASAFLQLPTAEIPVTAPPNAATQRLILSRAADNLVASVHKLPDFFARQTTNRFHDLKVSFLSPVSDPIVLEHQPFQPLDSFSNTIYYRNGHEEEETIGTQQGTRLRPKDGLVNWGVFGQLQRIVVTDIYKGTLEWSHWEKRASGPVAVFRYSIPKEKSNYLVSYCCIGLPNEPWHDFQSIPPFHGEIAIDPDSGAVYRLVIITDLERSDPIFKAEIMVEYEPVEIGGKNYICPRKSITITTAITPIRGNNGCWGTGGVTSDCSPPHILKPSDTAINDSVYDSYHVFRSEVRILPAEGSGQDGQSTSDDPASPRSTPQP